MVVCRPFVRKWGMLRIWNARTERRVSQRSVSQKKVEPVWSQRKRWGQSERAGYGPKTYIQAFKETSPSPTADCSRRVWGMGGGVPEGRLPR